MENKYISLKDDYQTKAATLLETQKDAIVISPTKVGYIIMATNEAGLVKKFEAKQRKLNKPAVVLCSSLEQLNALADLDHNAKRLYEIHWKQEVLLGCILPWKKSAIEKYISNDNTRDLVMDPRQTSCFVIKFGTPSEKIVKKIWDKNNKLVFASSANPSGIGNKGKVTGIGERIESFANLIISGDEYVESVQPDKDITTRYEQGVMVSLVDESGNLYDTKNGSYPSLIRKGLDVDKIMMNLAAVYNQWDYRQGAYY